jgi:hypothetical protein
MVAESTLDEDVSDTVFKYGVILAGFEKEAVEFLRKHVDRKIRMPESLTIGIPTVERTEGRSTTEEDSVVRGLHLQAERPSYLYASLAVVGGALAAFRCANTGFVGAAGARRW